MSFKYLSFASVWIQINPFHLLKNTSTVLNRYSGLCLRLHVSMHVIVPWFWCQLSFGTRDRTGVLSSDLFWRPVCDLETKGKIQGNTCCHADEGVWCPTAELYGGKGSEGEPLVTIHYPPSAHWNRTPKIELPLLVLLSDPT